MIFIRLLLEPCHTGISMVERVTKDVSSDTDGSLLNWNLLGSADGDEWHVLRQHENDTSLSAGKNIF
jgi:hypothetical protein